MYGKRAEWNELYTGKESNYDDFLYKKRGMIVGTKANVWKVRIVKEKW